MRWRTLAGRTIFALGLTRCATDPGTGAEVGLPEGVVALALARTAEPFAHWEEAGFVRMSPPVHLPQPAVGAVQVWLRVPEGATLDTVVTADGRTVLSYPPGTEADRVETAGEGARARVVDVRGTRIDADGKRWHHVYRSVADPRAPLVGMEWPASDPERQQVAVDALLDRLRDGGISRNLPAVRAKLDCDGCHHVLRPRNQRVGEHGGVARGTDAAGWFTPSTVLEEAGVVEAYGQRDPNLDDPWVTLSCGDAPVARSGAHASCASGAVPGARLDLAGALAAADPHAAEVCASWRFLADRLGQSRVRAHACGPGGGTP